MSDVAFLMPVWNADPVELAATMASLRAQSTPAHIVIVDDGSREPVRRLVPDAADVTLIEMSQNAGITAALNRGLEHILGAGFRYVARIDCGDLCEPDRIRLQRQALEADPALDLVGCVARFVSQQGAALYDHGAAGGPEVVRRMLWANAPFVHSSFFFRTDAVRRVGPYSPEYPAAEDYEFLLRLFNGRNIACLADRLVSYVVSPDGISVRRRKTQLATRLKAQRQYFRPSEPRAWAGIGRTVMTQLLPLPVVRAVARRLRRHAD